MRKWLAVTALACGCGRWGFDAHDDASAGDGIGDGAGDAQANRVFITSTAIDPSTLGGLAGADAECASRAGAVGLPGTYVAWLSSTTTDAATRLGSARGWVRMDGKPVTDAVTDLLAGKIFYPILYDESGNEMAGPVLTTSGDDGRLYSTLGFGTCADFTSSTDTNPIVAGIPRGTALRFTSRVSRHCNDGKVLLLYCFGIDHQTPVAVTPQSGRRAFLATGYVLALNGGLANADARCQADADAESLGGTFRALLATTTATAASRFDTSGPPWVRIDGARLADTAADFMVGNLETTIDQRADGSYGHDAEGAVWTGMGITGGTMAVAASNANCADWTSVSSAASGTTGDSGIASTEAFFPTYSVACNGVASLFCLEL